MTGKDDVWDFDQMDSIEIAVADAPKADGIEIAVRLGIGGRPRHRTGK